MTHKDKHNFKRKPTKTFYMHLFIIINSLKLPIIIPQSNIEFHQMKYIIIILNAASACTFIMTLKYYFYEV